MRQQLQHKRFTTLNDASLLSSLGCYWHVQVQSSIEPIGNVGDCKYQRPKSFYV
ncbi:MAG TPA: hypothetical protein VKT28_10850 [Puia sp.]|nr:hypothetical protein [Puia sp.]